VFANEVIESEMAFKDEVPTCRLDMGVHLDLVTAARRDAGSHEYDLCYVGDVSHERGAHRMLRGFARKRDDRTFALAGEVDPKIRREFEGSPGVTFMGRLTIEAAYDLMARSETGVCYLPRRRPYRFQTPVKILEYGAMGLKVVVNDTESNVATLRRHGIEGRVMTGFEFPGRADLDELPDNRSFDRERLGWRRLIAECGLVARLEGE
jgi:glycosyltransferase involved in cell wall biosynthesis